MSIFDILDKTDTLSFTKIFILAFATIILGFAKDIKNAISDYVKKVTTMFRTKIKRQNEDLSLSVKIGKEVNSVLINMRSFFRADRICVFEYHNSGIFNNGLSFIKATNTYELCEDGVCSFNFMLKDLPVQSFAAFNETILEHKTIRCANAEELKNEDINLFRAIAHLKSKIGKVESEVYYVVKVIEQTKSFYAYGLYNERRRAIGFVTMEYSNEHCALNDKDMEEFMDYCNRISVILSLKA